jgi:hypothetical protein
MPKKIFEAIHIMLIFGFIIGVPVAASIRPSGQEYSLTVALTQAGILALILIALIVVNLLVAEIFSRRASRRRVTGEHET